MLTCKSKLIRRERRERKRRNSQQLAIRLGTFLNFEGKFTSVKNSRSSKGIVPEIENTTVRAWCCNVYADDDIACDDSDLADVQFSQIEPN